MPKIQKVFTLEITPEQFLNACSSEELQELDLLLSSPRYRQKMNPDWMFGKNEIENPNQLRIPD